MSDLFDFQPSDINEKKFGKNRVIDPILFSNSVKPDIYILLDQIVSGRILHQITLYIASRFPGTSYRILSVLPFKPSEKDLKKTITELYGFNSIDLTKFIPDFSKVVTVGRALYAITKSDDLAIDGFYDTLEWKTSFFAPEIKSQVFPLPNLGSWLGRDCFDSFFVDKQIRFAKDFILPKTRLPKPTLVMVDDPNAFLEKWMDYDGITGWDLETKRLDPWQEDGRIICMSLAFEKELSSLTAYFLPFKNIDTKLLNRFFSNKKLIGNNSKFDAKWIRLHAGVDRKNLQIFWDNMQGSHAINELQYNSLKSDAWLYTTFGGYDIELEKYKIRYPKCKEDYSLIPREILFPYATMDALVSLQCYKAQQIAVDSLDAKCPLSNGWSIRRVLEDITFPAVNMFVDIELNGMSYDWDKLLVLSNELQEEMLRRQAELRVALNIPESVNIDSGDQLGKFLENIGWEDPGRSEKGLYLTNAEAMLYWKKKGHTEVELLNTYTECATVMKTFVGVPKNSKGKPTGYFQYRKSDNKLHGNFAVMMADSWRGKAYDPNLQNIIKNSTVKLNGVLLHERVRACYNVPSPDYVLSENDAAGLQLRIGATMSGDKVMHDIFTKYGGDMHSITGNSVFCPEVPLATFIEKKKEKPYKAYRQKAKACNFSLEFGSASFSFAKSSLQTEWSLDEAKEYVASHDLGDKQISFYEKLVTDEVAMSSVKDRNTYIKDQLEFSYYWASADDIRHKFFETYSGLAQWHVTQHAFAHKYGYIQSVWGPIRRVPLLIHVGRDDERGVVKNQENIVLNSPVQNFEVCYMLLNMVKTHQDMLGKQMKSFIVGNIHDSFIMYLHRTEMEIVKEISLSHFHKPLPELMGDIPYMVELGYSDCSKGDVWGVNEHEF